ncbi:MAG: rplU [Bacteroidetes bacterium]|nr:rplU [Bacteroidota bacterium]
MYAIIENGGHQHKVSLGETIKVQMLGSPYVGNAVVKAEIQGVVKGAKDLIFKKKPRKGHKKLRGHRQNFTVLKITDIVFGG